MHKGLTLFNTSQLILIQNQKAKHLSKAELHTYLTEDLQFKGSRVRIDLLCFSCWLLAGNDFTYMQLMPTRPHTIPWAIMTPIPSTGNENFLTSRVDL